MEVIAQVLTWSAYATRAFSVGRQAQTVTATLTPGSGAVSKMVVTNTKHDMFCPGISMLGSGDIVVTGGDNAEKTSIYKPGQGWKPGPDMKIPRGYQSSCTLGDGRVRKDCSFMLEYGRNCA
jgi:galactose oxidase